MCRCLALVLLALSCPLRALDWHDSAAVEQLFSAAAVTGTFVVLDDARHSYVGYNRARAETRFVPASTFKIAHTLIGLSVGAVSSVDEVLPYGGQSQPFKAWERDMGLRDAIALSNVPIYQALARRIGLQRMAAWIALIDYGNHDIGDSVDTFWLQGPLAISAIEQGRFVARLARGDLPVAPAVQAVTREIVLQEQGSNWGLYAKSGWQNAPAAGIGWWVGWLERDNEIYAFALNMDIHVAADADKRATLGKACLQALVDF